LCFGAGFSFAQPNLPSTHFDLSRFLVEPQLPSPLMMSPLPKAIAAQKTQPLPSLAQAQQLTTLPSITQSPTVQQPQEVTIPPPVEP